MENGIPYADIVILALIAGFILLRLRSILGQKQDSDQTDFLKRIKPELRKHELSEPVIKGLDKPLKNDNKEDPDTYLSLISNTELASAVKDIKAKDSQFSATYFLDGAKVAFEMVHDAFAKGDKQGLSYLLSDALLKDFTSEIEVRAKNEEKPETTLVAVLSKDITQAKLDGNMARVTVKFTSEQISVVRNAKGEIVQGNPSQSQHVEDEWVFERDVTSKNPNWKIIET